MGQMGCMGQMNPEYGQRMDGWLTLYQYAYNQA